MRPIFTLDPQILIKLPINFTFSKIARLPSKLQKLWSQIYEIMPIFERVYQNFENITHVYTSFCTASLYHKTDFLTYFGGTSQDRPLYYPHPHPTRWVTAPWQEIGNKSVQKLDFSICSGGTGSKIFWSSLANLYTLHNRYSDTVHFDFLIIVFI